MRSSTNILALHVAACILSIPLVLLYLVATPETSNSEGPWSYGTVSLVYIAVYMFGYPQSVFKAFSRFGISNRSARYTFLSVALFAAAAALSFLFSEFRKIILFTLCFSAIASFSYATWSTGEVTD